MMRRFALITCLSLQLCGSFVAAQSIADKVARAVPIEDESPEQRRELWSIWDFLPMEVLVCHGPLGHHNRAQGRCGDDSETAEFDSTAEFATETTESGATVYVQNQVAYDEEGAVVENYAAADQFDERGAGGNTAMGARMSSFNFWLLATMGSAFVAMAAVHVGQRKGSRSMQGHNLGGAVARRNAKVNTFANEAFAPDNEKKLMEMSSFEVEPGTVTEMNANGEIETRPGFQVV